MGNATAPASDDKPQDAGMSELYVERPPNNPIARRLTGEWIIDADLTAWSMDRPELAAKIRDTPMADQPARFVRDHSVLEQLTDKDRRRLDGLTIVWAGRFEGSRKTLAAIAIEEPGFTHLVALRETDGELLEIKPDGSRITLFDGKGKMDLLMLSEFGSDTDGVSRGGEVFRRNPEEAPAAEADQAALQRAIDLAVDLLENERSGAFAAQLMPPEVFAEWIQTQRQAEMMVPKPTKRHAELLENLKGLRADAAKMEKDGTRAEFDLGEESEPLVFEATDGEWYLTSLNSE